MKTWKNHFVFCLTAVFVAIAVVPAAATAADTIYWSNRDNDTLSFARLDGTGSGGQLSTAVTPDQPNGVAIDTAAGRIYWANEGDSTISFDNLDGSPGGGVLDTTGASAEPPHGLAIDPAAGRIYWAHNTGISFARLDGSGGGDLDTSGATVNIPVGVAIDPAGGRIYWANGGSDGISSAKLDDTGGGDDLDITGATPVTPVGVAIDRAAGRIYWANRDNSTISFANLNDSGGGGELSTAGATPRNPYGVAIDPAAGLIYWLNSGNGTISFAKLDNSGGGNELPTSGATLDNPLYPNLLRVPVGAGVPAVSGGSGLRSTLSCTQGTWAPDLLGSFLYRAPRSLAYQWTLNGADIPGATSSTHTAAAAGTYACRVTATNQAGSSSQTSAGISVGSKVCDRLRANLKRQKRGLQKADHAAKRAQVKSKIRKTRKRLKKLGCR